MEAIEGCGDGKRAKGREQTQFKKKAGKRALYSSQLVKHGSHKDTTKQVESCSHRYLRRRTVSLPDDLMGRRKVQTSQSSERKSMLSLRMCVD